MKREQSERGRGFNNMISHVEGWLQNLTKKIMTNTEKGG